MTLKQDLNPAALKECCRRIDMPEAVTEQIIRIAENTDFSQAEKFYPGLFSAETGAESAKGLRELYNEDDPSGLTVLTVMLAGVIHDEEVFRSLGMPASVYTDTMACFSRFVKEDYEAYGRYSFDRDFWAYRQLSMVLFRIGALEYEMRIYRGEPADTDTLSLRPGDPVISIHIPSDIRISRESLDASYKAAREFFAEFYPDFKYRTIWCASWLLSPALRPFLAPDSRILLFQNDFDIILTEMNDSNACRHWLFKNPSLPTEDLPENTSLQRKIKAALLHDDLKVGEGMGPLVR